MPTARRLMISSSGCKPEPNKGWWTIPGICCIAAYQPRGAISQANSYKNLAWTGEHDATAPVAPTWDTVNGWTFDGIAQYVLSGVVPDYKKQDTSVAICYTIHSPMAGWSHNLFGTDVFHIGTRYGTINTKRAFYAFSARTITGQIPIPETVLTASLTSVSALTSIIFLKHGALGVLHIDTSAYIGSVNSIAIGCSTVNGIAEQFSPIAVRAFSVYHGFLNGPTGIEKPAFLSLMARMAAL